MKFLNFRVMMELCLVVVLAMSGYASETFAENYYVAASSGNDGNRGTLSAPFKTLERGVSVLLPGDTLYVRGGTYQGFYSTLKIPSGNSWSQPVTVKRYQQENVVLVPPFSKTALQFRDGSEYIIVDGFIINGQGHGAGIGTGHNSHHIRVMNSEVMNAYKSGVAAHTGSYAFEFINLQIHDNGKTVYDHGLYISSSNHLIKDCSIYRNSGWGIHIYGGSKPSNNLIINNKIYNNARMGRGYGIGIYNGKENVAINNILWGNLMGIDVNWGASGSKLYNNTIYNERYGIILGDYNINSLVANNLISSSPYYGLVISKKSKNSQIKNNLVYGSASGRDILNLASTTILSKNLEGSKNNPKFQNVGGLDFRLQSGSSAIDSGIGLSEVKKDFENNSRPIGSNHDIGAFEKP